MRISGKAQKFAIDSMIVILLSYKCSSAFAQTCSGSTVKPSVNISTTSTSVCAGSQTVFVAIASNAGANPSFQWKINNVNAGTNKDTFATTTLKNGDVVSCVITADPAFACASPRTASSYGIAMNVSSSPPPSISISASANNVCPGTLVSFIANTQNTNSSATYQWKLNNDTTGMNIPSYSNNNLKSGDEIFCLLTDSMSCSNVPVQSNIVVMSLKPVPSITIDPIDTSVVAGSVVTLKAVVNDNSIANFQWQPMQGVSAPNSLSTATIPILAATNYFFTAVTNDGCNISEKITIGILHALIMPNAFTPNGDGRNDIFRIPANSNIKLQEFDIFDRWGNRVFSTSNPAIGWDGNSKGMKQDAGVYIYVIKGSDTKGKILSKGTFVLIR